MEFKNFVDLPDILDKQASIALSEVKELGNLDVNTLSLDRLRELENTSQEKQNSPYGNHLTVIGLRSLKTSLLKTRQAPLAPEEFI